MDYKMAIVIIVCAVLIEGAVFYLLHTMMKLDKTILEDDSGSEDDSSEAKPKTRRKRRRMEARITAWEQLNWLEASSLAAEEAILRHMAETSAEKK